MIHPKIGSVIETALYVDDMQRSVQFYQDLLGLEVMDALDRLTALRIDENQVLLIFKKGGSVKPTVKSFGTIPPTNGDGNLHLAVSISRSDVKAWRKILNEHGVAIESQFKWPEGGESIYFRDPDGHIIELKSSNWLGKEFDW